jgi:hypothetical protein
MLADAGRILFDSLIAAWRPPIQVDRRTGRRGSADAARRRPSTHVAATALAMHRQLGRLPHRRAAPRGWCLALAAGGGVAGR